MMKVFMAGLVISFALASSVSAEGLPANPWAASNNTVKINKADSEQRKNQNNAYQKQAQMIAEMERQNEIVRQGQAARRKAEAEASQRAAAARAQAQNSDSGGSFLDEIGAFFADSGSQSSAKSRPAPADNSDMFDMEWLQGYDDLKRNTEQSFNKVKRSFNALTDIDIEKTIDDTLKSLQ